MLHLRKWFHLACAGLVGSTLLPAQDSKFHELGKQTFNACSLCHAPDGKGAKTGDILMAPNLHESAFVKADRAEAMVAVILKGIEKEDQKYLQPMVPLEAALNDEQIAAVVSYVRNEWGGKKEKVKPNDVKKWRDKYKSQERPWKRADLAGVVAGADAVPKLSKVRYSVYQGNWNKLPDFSTMEPVQRGELKDGEKLSLEVAKGLKDNFGVVFEGEITLKKSETVEFFLHSDDGSALVIDGEGVLMNDGIHPGVTKTAKEKLEAGSHSFKILYFEQGGGEEFGFMAKAPSFGQVTYSKQAVNRGGGQSYDPIIIQPENPGEAIVHRAFLPDSKPRAIGVGYPGGLNLTWNADTLNLDYFWRGQFMDTSPHWNNRGSGSKPLGGERFKPSPGLPIQRLASLDESWIPYSEAKIKYERDTANPQREQTFNLRHPDYQFQGYRLDKHRFPTFRYRYQDLEVTDAFSPSTGGGADAFVRTIEIKGKAKENTYLRLASEANAEGGAEIDLGKMTIKIEGAEPVFRQAGGRKEVLAEIKGDAQIRVTYRWKSPRSGAELETAPAE